jgi:hypothetical protein
MFKPYILVQAASSHEDFLRVVSFFHRLLSFFSYRDEQQSVLLNDVCGIHETVHGLATALDLEVVAELCDFTS